MDMEYTNLFYKLIALRIKDYRKWYKIKQKDIEIDNSTLSKIENAKVIPKKNPYFLSGGHIVQLIEKIPVSPTELVWGQQDDKEFFLKLITLAILLNDKVEDKHGKDYSPFYNIPLVTWVHKEWENNLIMKEYALHNLEETKDKYGFFIDEKAYNLYKLLNPEFSAEYEFLSNLMLQKLNHNYEYSKLFYRHLVNYTKNTSIDAKQIELLLHDLVLRKGTYAPFILDKYGVDYPLFICTFNKFWDDVKETYLDYFEQQICQYDDSHLLRNGLKYINKDFFKQIFTSKDFISLNEEFSMFSEYTDAEAVLASLNMRLEITSAIQEVKSGQQENDKLLEVISITKDLVDYLSSHSIDDLKAYLKANV